MLLCMINICSRGGSIMGFFSSLKDKFSAIAGGGKKSNKSTVELQYDKAMSLFENANGADAIEILEGIADIGINEPAPANFPILLNKFRPVKKALNPTRII